MTDNIPYFDIDVDSIGPSLEGPIEDKKGFYKRVIEFVELNTYTNFNLKILCYLVDPGGAVMAATLEEDGYVKSLMKALEYYKEYEEYETCKTISNLIKKYE